MTGDESQTWYVKASFGAEWGPMSAGTLLEMADNGDLARDDLARRDLAADWQPVSTVIDQLRLQPLAVDDEIDVADDPQNAADSVTQPSEEETTLDPVPQILERPAPSKRRGGGLPGWSNYWTPDSTESPPFVVQPRVVFEEQNQPIEAAMSAPEAETTFGFVSDEVTDESSGESRDVPSATDMISGAMPADGDFAMLNAWKQDRKDRLDRLLKIVADREAAAREAALAQAESANNSDPQGTMIAEGESESATSPPIETPQRKVSPRPESWKMTLDRWKRSLPDAKAALVLLIAPLAVWWFWPESSGNVGRTYRLMYGELKELRELPNDKTGMEDFVQRSQAKLDQLIPVLEKRASPNRPESQWLLSMGRDCLRPMLKNPRQRESKPEATFKKLLAEWERIHGVSTNATSSRSEDEAAPPANREPSTGTAPDDK